MKSILVIGMGRFGTYLAHNLASMGNQVMVVDKDEDIIERLAPHFTDALAGDCAQEEVLKEIGVNNFDVVFVTMGSSFQSSLEVSALAKDLGAKHVVSMSGSEIQSKFLLRNGADEVIYPERDTAERIAVRASANNVFDYIELTPEYSIYEIPPMEAWLGKTIAQCNVRTKYHISILATKQNGVTSLLPPADHLFVPSEHLMVIGRHEDIQRVLKRI